MLSASAETPTTRRSPRAAARCRTRMCPTWKTSNVPKVMTARSLMLASLVAGPVVGSVRAVSAPSGPAALLRRLVDDDPGRPRITVYDDTDTPTRGERVELSARVLAN